MCRLLLCISTCVAFVVSHHNDVLFTKPYKKLFWPGYTNHEFCWRHSYDIWYKNTTSGKSAVSSKCATVDNLRCVQFFGGTEIFVHMITRVETPYQDELNKPLLLMEFTTENDVWMQVVFSKYVDRKQGEEHLRILGDHKVISEPVVLNLSSSDVYRLRYVGKEIEVMLIKMSKTTKARNVKVTSETSPVHIHQYHGGFSVIAQLYSYGRGQFLVSLPGALAAVTVSHDRACKKRELAFSTVFWLTIQNRTQSEYFKYFETVGYWGHMKSCRPSFGFAFCFNMTSGFSSHGINYLYLTSGAEHSNEARTRNSWFQASHTCKTYRAHLPVFHTREYLNHFMELLKSDRLLVPTDFIFIGLRKVFPNQVLINPNPLSLLVCKTLSSFKS